MNKSESKYFHTAQRMDEALLSLLEKKDLEYITVKEICERAGVNRSTFYLHYETMGDLLAESAEYLNEQFIAHMKLVPAEVLSSLHDCPAQELYFITPEYLRPYLSYVAEHRRLFQKVLENPSVMDAKGTYDKMFRHVFSPILSRFQVAQKDQGYMMAFYIRGLMAVISQWLKNGCTDSVDQIIAIMERCVGGLRPEP